MDLPLDRSVRSAGSGRSGYHRCGDLRHKSGGHKLKETFFRRFYPLIFAAGALLYLAGAAAAPLCMKAGHETAGCSLYLIYGRLCHQRPERSFFLGGYKMAICQRDVAIFGAFLLFCLFFFCCRRRIAPISWQLWLLAGILPMGLDGGTQMLGLRESTPLLRVLTGVSFAIFSSLYLFPRLEESLKDENYDD